MNKRLYHMAVLALVVEQGSFAGAARVLSRAASVVSTHVQQLEQQVGARLLHRTTRRLALTAAGERYLPHCQAVLAALRNADALAQRMRETVEGPLRITAPIALLDVLVVPALRVLLERYPAIEIDVRDSDVREALDSGEVDVAIRVGRLTRLGHRARRLGTLRDVRVQLPGCPDRAILLPWQARGPLAADGVIEVASVAAARAAALGGLGWAVLPEPAVRDALAAGTIERRGQGEEVPVYAVHAFAGDAPVQVRAFIEVAVEVAARLESAARLGAAGEPVARAPRSSS